MKQAATKRVAPDGVAAGIAPKHVKLISNTTSATEHASIGAGAAKHASAVPIATNRDAFEGVVGEPSSIHERTRDAPQDPYADHEVRLHATLHKLGSVVRKHASLYAPDNDYQVFWQDNFKLKAIRNDYMHQKPVC